MNRIYRLAVPYSTIGYYSDSYRLMRHYFEMDKEIKKYAYIQLVEEGKDYSKNEKLNVRKIPIHTIKDTPNEVYENFFTMFFDPEEARKNNYPVVRKFILNKSYIN